jgi:GMP synthase-like glutamine amidotransferase
MRVLVIRHHEEDSPGFIGTEFEARGARLTVHRFPADGPLPGPGGFDHIAVLGAVNSVNDDGPARDWIADELGWLRRADESGVPVLGICFGSQALAAAFGGRVEAAPCKEIGWIMVDSLDHDLIPPGPWMGFHEDRSIPPAGARLLASNDVGVQAFSIGRHLAVQFHPEVDGAQLKGWLDTGGRQEAEREGVDPDQLLAQTVAMEPAARHRAGILVDSARRIARMAAAESRP